MKGMEIGVNTQHDKVYVIIRVSNLMDPNLILKIYLDPRKHKRVGWEQCEGFSCRINVDHTTLEPEATGSSNTPLPLVRFGSAMQIEPAAALKVNMGVRLQAMEQETEEQKRGYEARIAAKEQQTQGIKHRARTSAKRSKKKARKSGK
jgi:hypothetical protein